MTLEIEIFQEDERSLAAYASIPIAFEVREILDLPALDAVQRGLPFDALPLTRPYTKDYDAYAGNGSSAWPAQFALAQWGVLAAYVAGMRVGGAVVIAQDSQIELLEQSQDLALLWDVRVAPAVRRSGVGRALLARVEAWAYGHGARHLRVETQNVNVPACRFYARGGFALERVAAGAYPTLPDELQLLWTKPLAEPSRHPANERCT